MPAIQRACGHACGCELRELVALDQQLGAEPILQNFAAASRRFDELLQEAQIAIEPVTEAQARIARQAYRDFGKISGHPAKLNFGDCFSYALAKSSGEALLFKGADFRLTDVKPAGG